jgi:Flagellar biosynthesis/type III secretory pathway protein
MSEDVPDTRSAFERWEGLEAVPETDREAEAQQRIRLAIEDARKQGYEAGFEQGRSEMEQETKRLRQLAESLGSALDSLDFRLADEVLSLALDVAKQVIAGELAARPERILDVVKLALRQMAESTREARLLLNPEDAKLVRPILNELLDKSRLRIVEDVRIVRGGCLIETPQGDLDATLQARWRQVTSVLGSNKNWLE